MRVGEAAATGQGEDEECGEGLGEFPGRLWRGLDAA
jgi:hypothetical protein